MFTETQELMFDRWQAQVQKYPQFPAVDLTIALRQSLFGTGESTTVLQYLLENPWSTRKEIKSATGCNDRELSKLLKPDMVEHKYTQEGCIYAVKGGKKRDSRSNHTGRGSMARPGKVSPPARKSH
jgi:hypothetical protein